ncbi:guanylate kinase-associated protein mars isoform X2 [Zophobas morio]|uniref:guanylate kinase-associated protein mars isoform X2 n=1 Tax=Zophobas morio TaxID=2755281 RepID=UPI003082A46D
MEDLSEFLKKHYCGLYKKKQDKFETVTKRVVKMNEQRKTHRHEELFGKRKIPLNMSPIFTPEGNREKIVKRQPQQETQPKATNKRIEMLVKWKAEKEKRKMAEKSNLKPVFKVSRVVTNVGLPNLENVNKEIKGKPFKSKFAPPNHQFKPPANIKPIHFNNSVNKSTRVEKNKTDLPQTQHRMTTRSKTRKGGEQVQPIEAKKTVPKTKLKQKAEKKNNKEKRDSVTSSSQKKNNVPEEVSTNKKKQNDSLLSPDFPGEKQSLSESDDVKTPKKTASPATVYVSPFVTVSRGKDSARKEYEARKSRKSFTLKEDSAQCTSPKAGAAYFMNILNKQIIRLTGLMDKWAQYKEEENVPEEAHSIIDVTIGQTNLLLTKKFMQFRGLIETCQQSNSETPVTCEDLHGFWDMMYIQVENLDKRYENLDNLKVNNWQEIVPEVKKVAKKKGRPVKNAKASAGLRAAIQAARRKKAAESENDQEATVEKTPNNRKSGSRLMMVKTDEKNRRKSSPGLMMMKVAQYAKGVETPGKSILKTDGRKSAKSHSKSVLFEDEIEDLENNLNKTNVELKAKTPTRKSKRLSKTKLF